MRIDHSGDEMPTRKTIASGYPFEDTYGYARAVRVGDLVFVSGTTARSPFLDGDAYLQMTGAIETIAAALGEAGRGDAPCRANGGLRCRHGGCQSRRARAPRGFRCAAACQHAGAGRSPHARQSSGRGRGDGCGSRLIGWPWSAAAANPQLAIDFEFQQIRAEVGGWRNVGGVWLAMTGRRRPWFDAGVDAGCCKPGWGDFGPRSGDRTGE